MLDFNLGMSFTADADKVWDLVIIGGGPAGMTAGLYAARYKLDTLLLEKAPVSGGQLTSTEWVENYPGFPEPVLGQKLAADMEAQARLFGLQVTTEPVKRVVLEGDIKEIHTDFNVFKARTVLIATGSSPRRLGVSGEAENIGQGVSYCATCDGPFYPDKEVAVVGGGNSALEESLFIAKYARKIHIIHRRDAFSADSIIRERVMAEPKISAIMNTVVEKLIYNSPDDRRLLLKDIVSGESRELKVDGTFVFVGNVPNTELFAGQLETEGGYLVTDREHRCNIDGVWAAGDVQAKALRQVATAVGDGAAAAYFIHKYLMNH